MIAAGIALAAGCGVLGLVAGAAGAAFISHRRQAGAPPAAAVAALEPVAPAPVREAQKRLRHDIRGALSPALLVADRLLAHQDPAVKRAGEIVVRAVDRASALLVDPAPDAPAAKPPAHP